MKIAIAAALFLAFAGTSQAAQQDAQSQALTIGPRLNVLGAQPQGAVETAIFDSSTGATFTITGSTPRTFMGLGFNVDAAGGPNPVVSRIVVYMAATSAVSYTNIRANVQLWDTYVGANDPVFSNVAGSLISVDLGPVTTVANNVYNLSIPLATPITLTGLTSHGIALNFQGDTGAGLVNTDALTTALRTTAPYVLGSNAGGPNTYGYRNASGHVDFNFAATDARGFAATTLNQGVALQIYASSTPVSLQSYSVD